MSNQRFAVSFPYIFSLVLCFVSYIPSCQVHAQSCFYPNGDPSKEDDRPCSSAPGSACCPLNWECLSNGLCYLESAGFYGRYTCTDKTWQSSGCPNLCTHSRCLACDDLSRWHESEADCMPQAIPLRGMKRSFSAAATTTVVMPIALLSDAVILRTIGFSYRLGVS